MQSSTSDPALRTAHSRTWPHVALALYVVVCGACLVWPLYDLFANRVEPYVLGLPFSLAWVAGWALLTFVVLVGYYFVCEPEA